MYRLEYFLNTVRQRLYGLEHQDINAMNFNLLRNDIRRLLILVSLFQFGLERVKRDKNHSYAGEILDSADKMKFS